MEFHTYHQFMLHAKSVVYVLMGLIVVGFVGFWTFMVGRDADNERNGHDEHH